MVQPRSGQPAFPRTGSGVVEGKPPAALHGSEGSELGATIGREIDSLTHAGDDSALIVEPVAGSTGCLPPPKGYLERLRKITADHGILLIKASSAERPDHPELETESPTPMPKAPPKSTRWRGSAG